MQVVSRTVFLVLSLLLAQSNALSRKFPHSSLHHHESLLTHFSILTAQELAAAYGLTSTQVLSTPPSTIGQPDAANYITSNWSLASKKISNNPQNIQFVADPFPNSPPSSSNSDASPSNTSATVMGVMYPQGSYSHDTGGTQFNQLFADGSGSYESMLLTYEVAFDQNFDFSKGQSAVRSFIPFGPFH